VLRLAVAVYLLASTAALAGQASTRFRVGLTITGTAATAAETPLAAPQAAAAAARKKAIRPRSAPRGISTVRLFYW
jgi:hypothetical protein